MEVAHLFFYNKYKYKNTAGNEWTDEPPTEKSKQTNKQSGAEEEQNPDQETETQVSGAVRRWR